MIVKTCLLSKALVAAGNSAGIRSQLGAYMVTFILDHDYGLYLGVSAHVLVNNCLLSKSFSTDATLKRFLPGVLPHVNFQMSCLFESFSTVLAVERPKTVKIILSSVSPKNMVILT